MTIEVGQVLWLKLPFGKTDDISKVYHPYLVLDILPGTIQVLEVGQIDSVKDKMWILTKEANKKIKVDHPKETVLYQLSYIQMDKKIQIEYFDEISKYRDCQETLSSNRLKEVIAAYYSYHQKHAIEDTKSMYFTREEIESLNPLSQWINAQKDRLILNDVDSDK